MQPQRNTLLYDGLINAVKGNVDEGLLFCGAKAWKAERLQTVQEVINDLF